MFQKTVTVDFISGKRKVNHGERTKYYEEDTQQIIVSKNIFDKVQEEMKLRERIVHNDDGSIEPSKNKYNSKYFLRNLLVHEDNSAPYRRRIERGKVLWRCATSIEKGKNECYLSPTLNEECLKEQLAMVRCGGTYNENVVKVRFKRLKCIIGTF